MESSVRAEMEERFGTDLSAVRIHADADAAASADVQLARAYTFGNHIVFGPDRYAPRTAGGRRLLAHELAHVLQQTQSHLHRGSASLAESEASEAGSRAARTPVAVSIGVGTGIQRQEMSRQNMEDMLNRVRQEREQLEAELEGPISSTRSSSLAIRVGFLKRQEKALAARLGKSSVPPPSGPGVLNVPGLRTDEKGNVVAPKEGEALTLAPVQAWGLSFGESKKVSVIPQPKGEQATRTRNLYRELRAVKEEVTATWNSHQKQQGAKEGLLGFFGGAIELQASLPRTAIEHADRGIAILDKGGPHAVSEAERRLSLARAWLDELRKSQGRLLEHQAEGAESMILGIKSTAAGAIALLTMGTTLPAAAAPWVIGGTGTVPELSEAAGKALAGEKVDWGRLGVAAVTSALLARFGGPATNRIVNWLVGAAARNPATASLTKEAIIGAFEGAGAHAISSIVMTVVQRGYDAAKGGKRITWEQLEKEVWAAITNPQGLLFSAVAGAAARATQPRPTTTEQGSATTKASEPTRQSAAGPPPSSPSVGSKSSGVGGGGDWDDAIKSLEGGGETGGFRATGPPVRVPAAKQPKAAEVLEVGSGPKQTELGLPPEKALVNVTQTDVQTRAGVKYLDAERPVPPEYVGRFDTVLINNPRRYQPNITELGKALRPGGRIIVQGKAEVFKGQRGINPDFNKLLKAPPPPGYRKIIDVSPGPIERPTRPEDILGGPFYRTEGTPVGWPNARIIYEKL